MGKTLYFVMKEFVAKPGGVGNLPRGFLSAV